MCNKKNGFTIVELIISIFILQSVIVAVFGAFSIVTILTADASDRLIGAYLAQEGMEIVRNIRDSNWLKIEDGTLNPGEWTMGLTTEGACGTTGCEADYASTSLLGTSNNYLETSTDKFYNYTTGLPTKFKRKIVVIKVGDVDGSDDHIIKVSAEVSWDKKATILQGALLAGNCQVGKNCIITEETLYDWY